MQMRIGPTLTNTTSPAFKSVVDIPVKIVSSLSDRQRAVAQAYDFVAGIAYEGRPNIAVILDNIRTSSIPQGDKDEAILKLAKKLRMKK